MKRLVLFVAVAGLLAVPAGGAAAGKATVAVLPFAVHSAENIEYIRLGILDMLSSRITVADQISVVGKETTLQALASLGKRDLDVQDIAGIGSRLNADYVVWGSMTKIGASISIDGRLHDVREKKQVFNVFTQSPSMDEVIPKINDFAQRIGQHILGTPPPAFAAAPAAAPAPPGGPADRETEIISAMRASKKGTLTSVINPDLISAATPVGKRGFWMSQTFPTEFVGMDVGDVNGDGRSEIVLCDRNKVYIYQKSDAEFKLIQRIEGKSYDKYLSLDVADINGNGISEIFVTNVNGSVVTSFVIEYREGSFQRIASDIRHFLRVVGRDEGPLLLGQRIGYTKQPFEAPIHEIVWEGGSYVEGKRMKIPQGLSIYGLAFDRLSSAANRVIALNEYDHLCIYEETEKPLSRVNILGGSKEQVWQSDEVFGGSNNYIADESYQGPDKEDINTYLNSRIITHDTNNDGKKEIVIVRNTSPTGRAFGNVRLYTSSEIFNFSWDGIGLTENWRTRKISGYVADYQFKDVDNDGQPEVVLALVQSTGVSIRPRSVVVLYRLNVPEVRN